MVAICFASVYFCSDMKGMCGCELGHESDTVCLHHAKNSAVERNEMFSDG